MPADSAHQVPEVALVPLHPTTAAALRAYAKQRRVLGYGGLCSAFFVSEHGARLNYHVLARTFVQLARRLGLRGPAGTRGSACTSCATASPWAGSPPGRSKES